MGFDFSCDIVWLELASEFGLSFRQFDLVLLDLGFNFVCIGALIVCTGSALIWGPHVTFSSHVVERELNILDFMEFWLMFALAFLLPNT